MRQSVGRCGLNNSKLSHKLQHFRRFGIIIQLPNSTYHLTLEGQVTFVADSLLVMYPEVKETAVRDKFGESTKQFVGGECNVVGRLLRFPVRE